MLSSPRIKELVKSQDMFGHTIHMNFNKQGPTHQTMLGAAVSVVIKVALLVFTAVRISKLATYGDDTYSSINGLMDVDSIENV